MPDLTLLPGRHAGSPAVRFGAGLELGLLHRGMNVLAMLTRLGLVRDWSRHADLLKRAADLFKHVGSDHGAMHVAVSGTTNDGVAAQRLWHLVATDGDGPYVPTLAAAALVRRWIGREPPATTGARPCVGLLSLQDFEFEARGLRITMGEARA